MPKISHPRQLRLKWSLECSDPGVPGRATEARALPARLAVGVNPTASVGLGV